MTSLRNLQDEKTVSVFQLIARIQAEANKEAPVANCSTICQPYSVPGGCTPCGTKCMMYCAGK